MNGKARYRRDAAYIGAEPLLGARIKITSDINSTKLRSMKKIIYTKNI